MNSEKVSLLSNIKFSSFEKINENFLKAKCFVLALGKNVNKSNFEKENVDKAYPTLAYAPVIGHLMVDENGIYHLGGHDYKLDLENFKLKSQCVPFGVVLPSESPVYEDVTESNGSTSTYLTCEVILWVGRYPELADAFYDDSVFTGQSMEIFYSICAPLKDDPTYTDIIDFSFDALCMLQKSDDEKFNVNPCFPSAAIVPITYSIDKQDFTSLMSELKAELSGYFENNNSDKGGNKLDKKLEILQKFNKTVDELDFSIENMNEDELSAKMEELFGEKNEPMAFSATYNQKREALRNALNPIVVKDEDGNYVEETHFYISDFDDEHVFVEVDHWTASGDYDCKYGRKTYTFDDSTLVATMSDDFEEMVRVWLTLDEKAKLDDERAEFETKYATIEKEFSDYRTEHSFFNADFESLRTYKADKEADERKCAEESLFGKYAEVIGESTDFSKLKENASNYSIDELEKECLVIVGKFSIANKPETQPVTREPLKFTVEKPDIEDNKLYGGMFEKYLKK